MWGASSRIGLVLLIVSIMSFSVWGTEPDLYGEGAVVPLSSDSLLSMDEAILMDGGRLWPSTLRRFSFVPGRESYSSVDLDGGALRVRGYGSLEGEERSYGVDALNRVLSTLGMSGVSGWPAYAWQGRDSLVVWVSEGLVRLDSGVRGGAVLFRYPAGSDNYHFSPGYRRMAFNVGERIEVMDRSGVRRVVTEECGEGIVNGRSVHRDEFGISGGLFWSPDGERLAFYRMDESMVSVYPLVEIEAPIARLNGIRYPMAGGVSHQVKVGVYDVGSGRVSWVESRGGAEDYLTNVTWDPSGEYLYIAELNRGQDTMHLNRFYADGRFERTLFEEVDSCYVEPQHGPVFLPGGGEFLWQSRRDGHDHLYLYRSRDGRLERAVTSGEWDVMSVYGVSGDGRWAYILSNESHVLGRDLYRVRLDGRRGRRERLTRGEGYIRAVVDVAGAPGGVGRYAAFWTSPTDGGGVYVGLLSGGKGQEYIHRSGDPLAEKRMPSVELVELTSDDGRTPLYGRLIRPLDFDSTKRYPVVIYVYGGPHAQMVDRSWQWGSGYWELYMAQRGYVVWVMDNRGSSGRGKSFEQVIHRRLGEAELADQLAGIRYLRSQPWVDGARIGVHGWSFGGFMTLSLMLRCGDAVKVAVAGGPVTDWKYYEVMYGERYMDRPEENAEGYARASLFQYAGALKGRRLLVVHGYQDPVVVPQHTLELLRAFVRAGEYTVDNYWYVGYPHNVRGRDRVHLMNKVSDYFDQHL